VPIKRDQVRQIADPAAQVQRAAGGVDGRLRGHGLWNVPVRAVLVLAHPRAELDVARSPVPVVRPFELVPLLRQLARERARLDEDTVAEAANALLDADAPTRTGRSWTRPARAQALVELACALSLVLVLAFELLVDRGAVLRQRRRVRPGDRRQHRPADA
jgi:hypothetical protein